MYHWDMIDFERQEQTRTEQPLEYRLWLVSHTMIVKHLNNLGKYELYEPSLTFYLRRFVSWFVLISSIIIIVAIIAGTIIGLAITAQYSTYWDYFWMVSNLIIILLASNVNTKGFYFSDNCLRGYFSFGLPYVM
jgi:hypothetical protein